ncbi:tRNA (N6-threonylcarbamoyladenosine(37)-N6)-methyltransferase TrmO [Mesorhizobium sp. CAU 1732]|uniref:tRNA (N6-threonylcarbamoyladenosine(37)-N6)-methyltransferase TrmO n=1 Tax=Mesorhizobium sp. CAU 1732 TaxID=3140358 RepID=UPI0032605878
MSEKREGEIELNVDPGTLAPEAGLVFIGRVRSPWIDRAECPKNMAAAREMARPASIEIEQPYRQGLGGLETVSHLVVLTWLDKAARNLIVQKPRHAAAPRGTFALRSPVRPNPVGVHIVRLTGLDVSTGVLDLEAIDVLDGTPIIDVKPYYASTDSIPDAITGKSAR